MTLLARENQVADQSSEIEYLRRVLANDSALAPVMNRIVNVPGEKLAAKVVMIESSEDDTEPTGSTAAESCARTRLASTRKRQPTAKAIDSPPKRHRSGAGVCVHVTDTRATIATACAQCDEDCSNRLVKAKQCK